MSYLSSRIGNLEAQSIASSLQTKNETEIEESGELYNVWKRCEILHGMQRTGDWMKIWAIPQEMRDAEVAKSKSEADFQIDCLAV